MMGSWMVNAQSKLLVIESGLRMWEDALTTYDDNFFSLLVSWHSRVFHTTCIIKTHWLSLFESTTLYYTPLFFSLASSLLLNFRFCGSAGILFSSLPDGRSGLEGI